TGLLAVVAGADIVFSPRGHTNRSVSRHQNVGEDIGHLVMDEGLEPEELVLHPGERGLRVVEQHLLEGRHVLLQALGSLAGLAQIRSRITGAPAYPVAGGNVSEPRS